MQNVPQILERLERFETVVAELRAEVAELKSGKTAADAADEFERLPESATVGKDYVAYRFRCSIRAAGRGEAGTHKIPRKSSKPLKWIKRDVDAAWREHTKPAKERAADARAKAKPRRRRSIITKREAA